MKVSVNRVEPVVYHDSEPPSGELVFLKAPYSGNEYAAFVRTAYILGAGFVTLAAGVRDDLEESTLVRMDNGHRDGWKWRHARQGESLTIAA